MKQVDTNTALMADKEIQYEDDGDILFATVKAKPAKPVALLPQYAAAKPEMVIGFPDVTEEEMDAIFAKPRMVDGGRDEDGPNELLNQTVRGRYL